MDLLPTKCLILLCLCAYIYARPEAPNYKANLYRSLLEDRYTSLPPVRGENVKITTRMTLRKVVSLENNVLTLDAVLSLEWNDNNLKWNPDEYGGINKVVVPSNKIWIPDIELMQSARKFTYLHNQDVGATILNNGHVIYIPHVLMESFCKYDTQKTKINDVVVCPLTFLSWTCDGNLVDLTGPYDVDLGDFENFSPTVTLVNATATRNVKVYACCPEPYLDLTYNIMLRREG